MKKEGSVDVCSGGELTHLERLVYNDIGGSAAEKISKEIKKARRRLLVSFIFVFSVFIGRDKLGMSFTKNSLSK